MLLHVNGAFGIGYPVHINNRGFKKFSVAHEIGHYRLLGHMDAVLDALGGHFSISMTDPAPCNVLNRSLTNLQQSELYYDQPLKFFVTNDNTPRRARVSTPD